VNKRTRLLAFVALGLAGLLVAGFALRAIILRPLRAIDDQIAVLQSRLLSLDGERKSFLAADTQVRAIARTLFAAKPADTEARLGALVTAQLLAAGLREADFTRIPAGRRRLPGAEEVGWTVQGEGPLPQVLDFLFLLQTQDRLHRVDSLAFSPANEPGRTRVRFRYLTLVLAPSPEIPPYTNGPTVTLDSPARRRYDAILRRDLFRPHEPESPAPPSPTYTPTEPGSPPPPDLRLVSLSSWGAQPEAHLLDTRQQSTRTVRPGDPLLDGTVVAIDDRPLPAAGKPGLLAYRRLILRIGDEFYAVDTGQNLADRRRLAPEELPPSIPRPAPTPPSP
jgi:hypothetical protein